MSIELKINKTPQKTYVGQLFMDGEPIHTARAARPGCVSRDLLNYLAVQYGMPEEVKVEVKEWE